MQIILIGPIGPGNSTVGELLAQKLTIPHISMDEVRFDNYKEIGYDDEYAKTQRGNARLWSVYPYWNPFEAHAVERILSEHHNCVIDLGAGHSVYEDENLFKRVQTALSTYPNVILLLPAPDLDDSVSILNEREEFLREMKP